MGAFRTLLMLLVAAATSAAIVAFQARISAQTGGAAAAPTYPKDVDARTANRFPPVSRADLDDYGKKVYDAHVAEGINVSSSGPVSLRLWDPGVAEHGHAMNQYVRNKAGLPPKLVELVILTTTRELNAAYEYSSHEPAGLNAGLSQQTIDVVKNKRPVAGLAEQEAAIIQLTREAVGQRKVSSETFARAEKLFGKKALVTMGGIMGEYTSAAILLAIADQHMPPGRRSLLPTATR